MKIDTNIDSVICCSTGLCGIDVDQQLVNFAADVVARLLELAAG